MVWVEGIGQNRLNASVGASTSVTAVGYFGFVRRLKVRSRVGLAFMALLMSACAEACEDEDYPQLSFGISAGSANPCVQQLNVDVEDEDDVDDLDLALQLYVNGLDEEVDHSSEFVKRSKTSGYFDLIVGDTLPSDVMKDGWNTLFAFVSYVKTSGEMENGLDGQLWVSDCVEEPVMSAAPAPEPDNQQPVSDLKAEFHFANSADTFGCPFMQVVDVAGVAENADVSLKLSIDGTPVEHTAEFISEGDYVQEGFDGYFDLVAGDNFNATLEGEHTLQVEVSDGVGSVEIEGKFTADPC